MNDSERSVLVTGATGFVASALLVRLVAERLNPRGATRRSGAQLPQGVRLVESGAEAAAFDWRPALGGCDAVVHTAARVHVMRDSAADPLAEFRRVNVDGTLHIARQAAEAGVRRFVFLSSIKVNGERTSPERPFTAADPPAPEDAYGLSKYEAEEGLRALARETKIEVAIIRPVLTYGPGVKANFESLMRWLWRGVPLPLGAVHNKRSLVALDNLVDLITLCVRHPAGANETFLVSDGEDLSTTELLRRTAAALGKRARLIPVPRPVLETGAALVGKRAEARRLLSSLQVDISKARRMLNWTPPVTVEAALRSTAAWFLTREQSGA